MTTQSYPSVPPSRPTDPSVTIVVPARNEARNLELVLPSLPEVHEVLVVDAGSTDDSESVVRRTLPTARFLQQTRRGKGNALAVGFEAATGDIIVMFDADGSADAAEISAYVSTLVAGADFAKGSRVLGDGGSEDITVLRDLGNRVLTGITNTLFRTHYTDLCYGYNAFWRDILPVLDLPSSQGEDAQWGDGFEVETMINARIATRDLQIHEVPSVELARIHGESNLNTFRDGFRVLRTILTERFRRGTTTVATPSADTLRSTSEADDLQSHPLGGESTASGHDQLRAIVVGPGWRFTSGLSYYTCSLTNALSSSMRTDALLMRQLIPTFLYPGRKRVGKRVNDLDYRDGIEVYDGVDWSWGKSMRDAAGFVDARHPQVVVLQWWTGAVLHSYLRLARQAKRRGAKVVMEWHEVQDTGEARIPGVTRYVSSAMRRLLRQVDAHVVHSTYDLEMLEEAYGITASGTSATVIPHGPYDHVRDAAPDPVPATVGADTELELETEPFNLLFFGVIRPYKGLEDLVEAFGSLTPEQRAGLHLTIVGETWEGWDAPLQAVAASPARDQITVVNRYVTDAEAQQHFAAADAVVLPYHRSSSSGPLQMAMSAGLPVVVTAVGGLVEAASGYDGVRFVEPRNVPQLAAAIADLPTLRGQRYADIRSWDTTVASYRDIFSELGLTLPAQRSSDSTGSLTTVSS